MPTPETIALSGTRFWPRVMFGFWLAEAALGFAFAAKGAYSIGDEPLIFPAALIVGGAFLASAGLLMAAVCWAAMRPGGPAVEMTSEGFRDRRIADQLIPWSGIRWGIVATPRGSNSLQFDVDPVTAKQLRPRWGMKWMGKLNRLFGYPEFTVMPLGTGKSIDHLAGLMSEYRQPSF